MELDFPQGVEELDVWSAERILQSFKCPFIFKWKIPSHPYYFFWRKCPDSGDYRLFITQKTDKTLFAESHPDVIAKYTPFLEEFIIDFRVYSGSGKQDKEVT